MKTLKQSDLDTVKDQVGNQLNQVWYIYGNI